MILVMMVHAFSFILYKQFPQSPELEDIHNSISTLILIYSSSSVKSDSSALTLTLFDLDVLFFLGRTAFLAFVYIVSFNLCSGEGQLTFAPLLPPRPTTPALSPSSSISTSPSSSSNSDPDESDSSSSSEESCVFLDFFLGFFEVGLVLLMGDERSVTLFYSSASIKQQSGSLQRRNPFYPVL
jgi:hypothetical protein